MLLWAFGGTDSSAGLPCGKEAAEVSGARAPQLMLACSPGFAGQPG